MPPSNKTSNSSIDRWELIQSNGKLNIGLAPDLPGMGYWNADKNCFEGFEADLARRITKELLGDEEKATFFEVPPGERLPRIVSGELDMVLSQLTITKERLEIVDFSDPYLYAQEALLVLADSSYQKLEDLTAKTVAVAVDTASFHRYSTLHPEINLITTTKESDGVHLLLEGRVDAVANDNVNLSGLLASMAKSETDKLRSVDVAKAFDPKPFGVCIKKGSPAFLSNINKAIQTLKDNGTLEDLFKKSREF